MLLSSLVNIIDIVIVALLAYAILLFLRRTGSMLIFRGIVALFFIYIFSSFLDLPLTHALFTAFFSFFVIVLVVVFQRELRGFFEDFGVSLTSLFKGRYIYSQASETISTIVETVDHLAKKKTGAIIVLPGRIPVGRFLKGGFSVNGEVNEPLLLSIFDARTPGHDGAVVIEDNEIKKFAVHLPLAENFDKYRKYGTRHRAALGLAERTDAFVVVVSEERGTIMVAEKNTLAMVEGSQVLEEKIREFYSRHQTSSEQGFAYGIISYNIKEKALALFLAVLAWLVIVYK